MIKLNLGKIKGPPGKNGKGQTSIKIQNQIQKNINFNSDPQLQLTQIQNKLNKIPNKDQEVFTSTNYSKHNGSNTIFINNPIATNDNFITQMKSSSTLIESQKSGVNMISLNNVEEGLVTNYILDGDMSGSWVVNCSVDKVDTINNSITMHSYAEGGYLQENMATCYLGKIKDICPSFKLQTSYYISMVSNNHETIGSYYGCYGLIAIPYPEEGVPANYFLPIGYGIFSPEGTAPLIIPYTEEELIQSQVNWNEAIICIGAVYEKGIPIGTSNIKIENITMGEYKEDIVQITNVVPQPPITHGIFIKDVTENSISIEINAIQGKHEVDIGYLKDFLPTVDQNNLQEYFLSTQQSYSPSYGSCNFILYNDIDPAQCSDEQYSLDNTLNHIMSYGWDHTKLKIVSESYYENNNITTVTNIFYLFKQEEITGEIEKSFDNPYRIYGKINNIHIKESWGNKLSILGELVKHSNNIGLQMYDWIFTSPYVRYTGKLEQMPGLQTVPPMLLIQYINQFHFDLTSLCDFTKPEPYYQIGMYYFWGLLQYIDPVSKQTVAENAKSRLILEYSDKTTDFVEVTLNNNINYDSVILKIKTNLNKTITGLKFFPLWIPPEYAEEIPDPNSMDSINNLGVLFIKELFFNPSTKIPIHLSPIYYDRSTGNDDYILYPPITHQTNFQLPLPIYSLDHFTNEYIPKRNIYNIIEDKNITLDYKKEILYLLYNGTENWHEEILKDNIVYFSCEDFIDPEIINNIQPIVLKNKDKNQIAIGTSSLLNFINETDLLSGKEGIVLWNDKEGNHLKLYTAKFNTPGSLQNFKDFLTTEPLEVYTICEDIFYDSNVTSNLPLYNKRAALEISPKNIEIILNNSLNYYNNYFIDDIRYNKTLNVFTSAQNIVYQNKNIIDTIKPLQNFIKPTINDKYKMVYVNNNQEYIFKPPIFYLTSPDHSIWEIFISDQGILSSRKI